MKPVSLVFSAAALCLVASVSVAEDAAAAPQPQIQAEADVSPDALITLPTDKGEKWPFSYTMGYTLGMRLLGDIPEVDRDAFNEGIQGALANVPPQLTDAQMHKAIKLFNQGRADAAKAAHEKLAAENQQKSQEFLAANGKRKGVKTTKSGLQYEVLKKGSGPSPKPEDEVTAHYVGTLPDGTVFDSSRDRKQPEKFPLSRVIPGWIEGLQLMNKGADFKLYIPANLAYGPNGNAPDGPIGPNQALVFEVELLEINSGEGGMEGGTDPSALKSNSH